MQVLGYSSQADRAKIMMHFSPIHTHKKAAPTSSSRAYTSILRLYPRVAMAKACLREVWHGKNEVLGAG
jgi:hypothetical protein